MSTRIAKALSLAGLMAVAAANALGQSPGWTICYPQPPPNPPPPAHSPDYLVNTIGESPYGPDPSAPLMNVTIGGNGTVTMGGMTGPCFAPAITLPVAGRIGFMVGNTGSIQSDFDDNLMLTFGMPFDPAGNWSYATINKTNPQGVQTRQIFQGPFTLFFHGASDRYLFIEATINNVDASLRCDVIGDAARLQWTLVNGDGTASNIGLWFGQWLGMLNNQLNSAGATPEPGFPGDPFGPDKRLYVVLPGRKPITTEHRFIRSQDPNGFPQFVNADFSQSQAYGLRIENGPTADTSDSLGQNSDSTPADEFVYGNEFFLLGSKFSPTPANFPDFIFGDVFVDQGAYIQKYYDQSVGSGQSRTIVEYFRSTWADSNYAKPYSVVVDPPKVLAFDPNSPTQISPNPFLIRVWIDDTRGFSTVDQSLQLADVRITLTLPTGLTLVPGENAQKIISRVDPQIYGFVDYHVQSDGVSFGQLPYSVKVEPANAIPKTINGTIIVSATPRLRLIPDSNLVTTPWTFNDSSWENILGLHNPTDFQAFEWDPLQKAYIVSTSAARGHAAWIVAKSDFGSRPLAGNPQQPGDLFTGAPLIQLQSGWNLIGNPYNYPFPLGQIVGASLADGTNAVSWQTLVAQNLVSGSLAYWDPDSQSYKFISGNEALMQPNRGYWIFLFTNQPLTISFPPIFQEFVPGSNRSTGPTWTQSANHWRANMVARTNKSIDDQNFVGMVSSSTEAGQQRMLKPPTGPTQDVTVAVLGTVNGKPMRLAQDLASSGGRQQWTVQVDSKAGGSTTLTWPNMTSVPRNVRFRLVDKTNGRSRDMRQTSGYTYAAGANTSRQFTVQVEPGSTAIAPVIGNVIVSAGRGVHPAAYTINYTLSAEATTSIRILNAHGAEIFSASRGRADSVGQNSVAWGLRDNAGRSVAPGVYRVEIVAETPNGDRTRKFIPINVIR